MGGDDAGVRVVQLALQAGWLAGWQEAQVWSEAKLRLLSSPIFLLCPFLSNSHLCTVCTLQHVKQKGANLELIGIWQESSWQRRIKTWLGNGKLLVMISAECRLEQFVPGDK